jgi:hypothetical protein
VALSEGDEALDAALAALAPRVLHIHARIGDECRPQLDPRTPGAAPELRAFAASWREVWEAQARAGLRITSFTPEHGPPPYAPADAPPGELDAANLFLRQRVTAEFDAWRRDARKHQRP